MSRNQSRGMLHDYLDEKGIGQNELLFVGGLAALIYIIYQGGLEGAVKTGTQALVNMAAGAAKGAVTGVASGVGSQVGLPMSDETTQDPYVARYILDDPQGGYAAASTWAGAQAFYQGLHLAPGSGYPPPPNSPLARRFPTYVYVPRDETDPNADVYVQGGQGPL